MAPLSAECILHPRELFNGTFPGIGLDGTNPSTASTRTSLTTSPSGGNGAFNPNPPTEGLQAGTTATTSSSPATTSLATTSTTTTSTQSSAMGALSESSSNRPIVKSQSSVGDALFATSRASTTASSDLQPTGNSSPSTTTLSSTTTSTQAIIIPSTTTISGSSTSFPTGTRSSSSPQHSSSPVIIVGAVLAGIVAMTCLLAAFIYYRHLRGRRGRRDTDENPAGRPRLVLDTRMSTGPVSSPLSVTPYNYQSPSSRPSPFHESRQGEVTTTHVLKRRNHGPYSAARDTLRSVHRVVHRSHISPSHRTVEPGFISRRDSRIPLLESPDQAVVPSYSSQDQNFNNSPVSMYTASPALTGQFNFGSFPSLPYAPSEKQRDSVTPSRYSIHMPHSGDESASRNDGLPVEYIPDNVSEVVSEPPPAYES